MKLRSMYDYIIINFNAVKFKDELAYVLLTYYWFYLFKSCKETMIANMPSFNKILHSINDMKNFDSYFSEKQSIKELRDYVKIDYIKIEEFYKYIVKKLAKSVIEIDHIVNLEDIINKNAETIEINSQSGDEFNQTIISARLDSRYFDGLQVNSFKKIDNLFLNYDSSGKFDLSSNTEVLTRLFLINHASNIHRLIVYPSLLNLLFDYKVEQSRYVY